MIIDFWRILKRSLAIQQIWWIKSIFYGGNNTSNRCIRLHKNQGELNPQQSILGTFAVSAILLFPLLVIVNHCSTIPSIPRTPNSISHLGRCLGFRRRMFSERPSPVRILRSHDDAKKFATVTFLPEYYFILGLGLVRAELVIIWWDPEEYSCSFITQSDKNRIFGNFWKNLTFLAFLDPFFIIHHSLRIIDVMFSCFLWSHH